MSRTAVARRRAWRQPTKETPISDVPHELAEEFPDKAGQIHKLKNGDARFRKLCDEYHEVNRAIAVGALRPCPYATGPRGGILVRERTDERAPR